MDTMTAWEKEWMHAAPQDCLRTFVLNPTATGGYSEYGETMLDYESTETLTEDNGQAKVSLLKVDAVAPLFSGTFIRMYLFGSITDGVPVWQVDANGEPKNYRNYYIHNGNSRWFERHPTGHVDRYKHDYVCNEIIACLKDYPIRSVKTFAEGAYTFKKCLDIAFSLAFRPRTVGKYAYVIKDFPGLDEPNSKLEYVNSTLYDVVTDIGRIIDAVPSMEITFADGIYTFELRFTDRYGLEGEVHDISYFNMKLNDAVNVERDTSAGASISYVQNLIAEETRTNMVQPNETNVDAPNDWSRYTVPYPIEELKEIRIQWQWEIERDPQEQKVNEIFILDGKGGADRAYVTGKLTGKMTDTLLVINKDRHPIVYIGEPSSHTEKPTALFLAEKTDYDLSNPVGSINEAGKDNTIYYTRGDNHIFLNNLFGKRVCWWYKNATSATEPPTMHYNLFTNAPTVNDSMRDEKNPYKISVTYKTRVNGVIKGANSKPSDVTVFFNQQGQVVDIQSFGTAVNNYTKTMFGENRVLAHTYCNIGRQAMYEEMPRIGSSVLDKERGKRYVVTDLSFTRRMNGGLLLATLAESRAGKSRRIIADNRQKCYAIPNESIVESMSHTHIICKMGVKAAFDWDGSLPEKYTFTEESRQEYLFNAFGGTQHVGEHVPTNANLRIFGNNFGIFLSGAEVVGSKLRLSYLMSMRMRSNRAFNVKDGDPVPYTDENGQFNFALINYLNTNNNSILSISQMIHKDDHEIFNHSTQISWVEFGNLQISDSIIDMSYFGKGKGLNAPLQLVLLSSRMRLNDTLSDHTAARYDLAYTYNTTYLRFVANGMTAIPEHVGWAITRGNTIILLDNFDILTDNTLTVFYKLEIRD